MDEVEVVQEHSFQLMSRVAEPGARAPVTIWARLQALKRTLALEVEARFLHEALPTPQLLHYVDIGHKKEIDECARISPSLKARAGRLLWVTLALLIGALWSWFTEFARPCRWPTGASSPSLSRLGSTHG